MKHLLIVVVFVSGIAKVLGTGADDPLLFPKDRYTTETKTVKTSSGEKKVIYRSYMHILYVARPVDKDYQSLNVSVPINVDGVDVDATNAPILFVIGVGGYMSVSNTHNGGEPIKTSSNADLALAAGYVVVSPACRGRDNKAADGTWYGKAPAAIVDLKAAVRYIRHNKTIIPGNTDWIFSTGVSAGGALSALLGASGNSPLYEPYLTGIGAADADDAIYGCAAFCPITDLDHADGAYEWMYGASPTRSGLVDQTLSKELKTTYRQYQASLRLQGRNNFGPVTADNYDRYLLQYYLLPSANKFLNDLTTEKRTGYLSKNPWITWTEKGAAFTFAGYVTHVGRMKGLPAFDDLNLKNPEPIEFGDKTTDARHFTDFSLQHTTGNQYESVGSDLKKLINIMNVMYFIGQRNSDCAKYWWLRQGTSDNHTSQTVIANLATKLENQHKDVNARLYWDAGHGSDEDAEDFIAWIGHLTGSPIHTTAVTTATGILPAAASKDQPDPGLAAFINHISAIDNHAHPNTIDPNDKDADALPLDTLGPIQLPARVRPESPVWITAAKALYGFDGATLDQQAIKTLTARQQDTLKQKGVNFPDWALDQAGIEVMLGNRVAMGPGLSAPRFRWVSFVDAFLFPLSTKTEAAATPDRKKLFPMEAQHLQAYLNGLHFEKLPATLDVYLKQVVTATLESQQKAGCLAVKFEAAYLRSLDVENPTLQEAQKIYAQYINGGEPSHKDNKCLQDYIFRYIAREAGRLGMAVHIHSYPAAGDYFVAKDCDPLLLESVFNDPALRNTNFVILHGGGEFWQHTAAMLWKPNVYADISLMTQLWTPRELAVTLRHWLSQFPEKVLFATDADAFGPGLGWEMSAYLAATSGREALTLALTGMVADHEISLSRAKEIATMVMRGNANTLYHLGL
jgi:acetyl esterase/lipase